MPVNYRLPKALAERLGDHPVPCEECGGPGRPGSVRCADCDAAAKRAVRRESYHRRAHAAAKQRDESYVAGRAPAPIETTLAPLTFDGLLRLYVPFEAQRALYHRRLAYLHRKGINVVTLVSLQDAGRFPIGETTGLSLVMDADPRLERVHGRGHRRWKIRDGASFLAPIEGSAS